jgi:hypothetical protein
MGRGFSSAGTPPGCQSHFDPVGLDLFSLKLSFCLISIRWNRMFAGMNTAQAL